MKLTGKTKEEFENWFNKDLPNEKGLTDEQIKEVRIGKTKLFNRLTFPMQIGVLILYFDSVEVYILSSENNSSVSNKTNIFFHCKDDREQAWKQAVEKANEIRNKQL